MITDIILPLLGIVIIIFSVLSFFFPYGEKFVDKIQKIKMFGVDMEVSILTLFIVVGVMMSFSGIYLHISNYEEKIIKANIEKEKAEFALAEAKKMEMKIVAVLEGVGENLIPKLADIQCEYWLPGDDKSFKADIIKGITSNSFKIIIKDITPRTHISKLLLRDISNNTSWIITNFMPLEPTFKLIKET
jgi:Na+-transporting NADH:ubiquinone oxidoreductase subunit NqrC